MPMLAPRWFDPETSYVTPGWGVPGVPGSAGISMMYPVRRLAELLNQALTMDDIVEAAQYCVMLPLRAQALVLTFADDGRLWVLGHSGKSSGLVRTTHGVGLDAQVPAARASRGRPLFFPDGQPSPIWTMATSIGQLVTRAPDSRVTATHGQRLGFPNPHACQWTGTAPLGHTDRTWTRSHTMTVVKAAAVQISPVLYSRAGTVEKVVKKIDELGQKGVEFAVFPETVVPYYPYFSFVQPPYKLAMEHLRLLEESVTVPSAETDAIGDAARKANMVVSIGVNERDGGTIYNTQLLFDADGALIQRRRKITPTYHERMIWGQGDGSGLRAVDSVVGRIGQLACWEHYQPLARYALIADGEQIHAAMYPGAFGGDIFAEQIEVNVRQHALESASFVVSATAWLDADQQAQIAKDTGGPVQAISGGFFTAIIDPDGRIIGEPITSGEGEVIADLDFALIDRRKRLMDASGHYSRPELLSLQIDRTPAPAVHDRNHQGASSAPATEKGRSAEAK
ncbi:nitrilase-related carbon-nitrogen hydrolase [Streptomyces sp. NPDC006475]|uniref:nitrilase-related carbon-nitrogen hydrolase n=1 Tax=Streptomyces sp. NPDC006475 TaxID=3155719 RepID=UPI0033B5980D